MGGVKIQWNPSEVRVLLCMSEQRLAAATLPSVDHNNEQAHCV